MSASPNILNRTLERRNNPRPSKHLVVPPERSKQMVEAIKKKGGNPKFTIYPDTGHYAWTEAYNTPELYEWLLQQKRTTKKVDEAKK